VKDSADSSIQVLFRYRDLIAETLAEHNKIIAKEANTRGCWWGWWKRPTEEMRSEVWTHLKAEIAAHGHATIGLFNSGAKDDPSAVRKAVVVEIIEPQHGEMALASPALPKNELELVPPYYRKSPFSRAWLRLTEIAPSPFEFFGKYSYDRPPPLPGIPDRYLSRLAGKVVIDREELRAMDTTIWQVRARQDGDHVEKFLAPTIHVNKAASPEPIRVKGDKILHLTDLHFAETPRDQHVWAYPGESGSSLAEQVGKAVQKHSIGLIVVSGDLTYLADPNEFKLACESINSLLGSTGVGPDQVVIVPGNHDIAWTKPANAVYDPTAEIVVAPPDATRAYRDFYRKLLQHEPNERLSMARRYVFPHGGLVEVCALNSSNFESGQKYLAGMGLVDATAFSDVASVLDWNDTRKSLALRLLVLHHHLTATEDVEDPAEYKKGFGMALDGKKIIRDAAKRGVHLVLHGHRHRAFFWRENVFELPEETRTQWSLGDVSILGGGSAGSKEVVDKKHYFNLITVHSDALKVDVYRSKQRAAFEVMCTWEAPIVARGGRLLLESWKHVNVDPAVSAAGSTA
jgi:hypothetical protein